MFVAWRDMRFATGRFVLIGAVVSLITLLVGFLSGLTAGLANQNISAITGLGASSIVLAGPADDGPATFADSTIDDAAATRWAAVPGVDHVLELGISQTRLTTADARTAVALFGTADAADAGRTADTPADGTARLSRTAAEALDVVRGDTVSVGGEALTVRAIVDDQWYSHTPVVWTSLSTWRSLQGAPGAPGDGAPGAGAAGVRGGPPGDLYIFLSLTAHQFFQRDGADLHCRVPISMVTAALGGEFEVPTIDKGQTKVKVPAGTQSSRRFRIASKGMPVLRSRQTGDMYVQVVVETPQNLTKKQQELLMEFEKLSSGATQPEAAGFFSKVKDFFGSRSV